MEIFKIEQKDNKYYIKMLLYHYHHYKVIEKWNYCYINKNKNYLTTSIEGEGLIYFDTLEEANQWVEEHNPK